MAESDDKEAPPLHRKEGYLKGLCENTGAVLLQDFHGTKYLCSNDSTLRADLQHFDMPLNQVPVAFTPIDKGLYSTAIDVDLFPNGDCPKDLWEKYTAGRLKFLKKKGRRGWNCEEKGGTALPKCIDNSFEFASEPEPSAIDRQVLQATHTDSTISPNITLLEDEKPMEEKVIEPVEEAKPEPIEEEKAPVKEEKEASVIVKTANRQFFKAQERNGFVYFGEVCTDIEEALEHMELKEPAKTEEKKVLKSILKPPTEMKMSYDPAAFGWPRPKVPVEPGWWKMQDRVMQICRRDDPQAISKMHRLLNKWWYVPQTRYRNDYPFTLDGFIVPIGNGKIHIYTIRLGRIEVNDRANRRDRTYAYCLVIAEGEYRAWEFDDRQPPTLDQVTPVGDSVECRGYALISPGAPSENTWFAWNDQCGWMTCAEGCADDIRENYPGWTPGCELVKFAATYVRDSFVITKISLVTLPHDDQLPFYPLDLFYIDDIRAENGEERIVFSSNKMLKERVECNNEQVYNPLPEQRNHGGLVCVTWEAEGLQRVTRALVVAPLFFWKNCNNTAFYNAARHLSLTAWNKKRRRKTPPVAVANPCLEEEQW